MGWFRHWIRKSTTPIPKDVAGRSKQILSLAYAFLASNSFILLLHYTMTSKAEEEIFIKEGEIVTPASRWAKRFKIEDALVYKVSGVNLETYKIEDGRAIIEDKEKPADKSKPVDEDDDLF